MPRLVYNLPKYSPHRTSGRARVKHSGKTTYLGKYGSPESKEAYAAFLASIPKVAESTTSMFADPAPGAILMVGEIVPRYLEHAKRYSARDRIPTGEHTTIFYGLRPLVELCAELPASEFGPKRLKQVRQSMIDRGWSRRFEGMLEAISPRKRISYNASDHGQVLARCGFIRTDCDKVEFGVDANNYAG